MRAVVSLCRKLLMKPWSAEHMTHLSLEFGKLQKTGIYCDGGLTLLDHIGDFDTAKVTAAEEKDLNTHMCRTLRLIER